MVKSKPLYERIYSDLTDSYTAISCLVQSYELSGYAREDIMDAIQDLARLDLVTYSTTHIKLNPQLLVEAH